MRTSAPYPCGCVVLRDDNGCVQDVLKCRQHQNEKNLHHLMGVLNVHPVLDVQITDRVSARDKFGR